MSSNSPVSGHSSNSSGLTSTSCSPPFSHAPNQARGRGRDFFYQEITSNNSNRAPSARPRTQDIVDKILAKSEVSSIPSSPAVDVKKKRSYSNQSSYDFPLNPNQAGQAYGLHESNSIESCKSNGSRLHVKPRSISFSQTASSVG